MTWILLGIAVALVVVLVAFEPEIRACRERDSRAAGRLGAHPWAQAQDLFTTTTTAA